MQSNAETYQAIREGNEAAFEMTFKTYYKPLCQYAFSFLNNRSEAEEVVQSTFIKIWEKKKELAIDSSLKAYLYSMVRNSCLNAIKHEKVKQQHAQRHLRVAEQSRELVTERVFSNELESQLYQAMKALPEQCRLVFQLSRFEELKYQEIADQLQISVKTVENQMGKALKIMRNQLKDYLAVYLMFLSNFIL